MMNHFFLNVIRCINFYFARSCKMCVYVIFIFLQKSKDYKVVNLFIHSKMYKCNENVGLWLDANASNKYYKIK